MHAGDSVVISAVANSGYTFSGWTVSGGNCYIEDQQQTSTTLTAYSDTVVIAGFTSDSKDTDSLKLRTAASPADYGTVTPATGKVTYGSTTSITAASSDSSKYTFLYWQLTGNGRIDNPDSATTSIIIYGNVSVTAVFTELSATSVLTVSSGSGGNTQPSLCRIKKGETRIIRAIPYSGYFFRGWTVNSGEVTFVDDCQYSSKATVKADSDADIKANFSPITYGTVGTRYKIDIYDTNKTPDKDWVRILRAPLPYDLKSIQDELDKKISKVLVSIDGSVFIIDKMLLRLNRNNTKYKYKSADGKTKLTFDFKKEKWFFRTKKRSLPFLDNSDGTDIMLKVGNLITGGHYAMGERGNWRIKNRHGDNLDILKARGMSTDYRENKDYIRIFKGLLPGTAMAYPDKSLIITIDNMRFVAPANTFDISGHNNGILKFPSRSLRKDYKNLKMNYDTFNSTWKMYYVRGDYNRLIDYTNGLKVYLLNGKFEASKEFSSSDVTYTRRLKYTDEDD